MHRYMKGLAGGPRFLTCGGLEFLDKLSQKFSNVINWHEIIKNMKKINFSQIVSSCACENTKFETNLWTN